ncbi:MAG: DUF1934 domain-containing protein [Lachnospiraceae bacterium]|nr:DUF1934 domain-containing protein [Lachnospiraceae bacterium]
MTKDVLISIKGLQFDDSGLNHVESDEELDLIETICPGKYYYKNGAHYLLYEEVLEDFLESARSMIKLRDKEFTLVKKGAVNAQMVFSEGKKTLTDYQTPLGNILIALDTQKIEVQENEDRMDIHITYGLEANYQFIADCSITIIVKSHK